MSNKKTVNITCPRCNYIQDVDLYESINANKDFELKEALMRNKINRINCDNCDFNFRVDLPFLYFDSKNQICIHWVPEIKDISHEQILEEFDQVISQLDTRDTEVLRIRLVRTRVELVELIFVFQFFLYGCNHQHPVWQLMFHLILQLKYLWVLMVG